MDILAKQAFIRLRAQENQADPPGTRILKMTGKPEKNSRCAFCGGRVEPGVATIPFVLPGTVVVIKDVPAEICRSCHEPFMTGAVTDRITGLLQRLRDLGTEVSIVSYSELAEPVLAS